MAKGLDAIEGELIEGGALLLFLAVLALILLGYLAVKDISIPVGAYPDSVFSKFASWIDELFNGSVLSGSPIQKNTDHFLGGIWGWINENLPVSTKSKNFQAYTDANAEPGAAASEIDANQEEDYSTPTLGGDELSMYQPQASG